MASGGTWVVQGSPGEAPGVLWAVWVRTGDHLFTFTQLQEQLTQNTAQIAALAERLPSVTAGLSGVVEQLAEAVPGGAAVLEGDGQPARRGIFGHLFRRS